MIPRPYALLAELTYRCPLHCPYCSNPTAMRSDRELTTAEWQSVMSAAAELGVLQVGFSGGEPLVRQDLPELIEAARGAGLYTNLITSGVGLDEGRARALRGAGLDSVQLSFQADTALVRRFHCRRARPSAKVDGRGRNQKSWDSIEP